MSDTEETILFDDYFSDPEDAGVAVDVWHRGKLLHFVMRKSLTLKERQKASGKAIKISLDATGQPHLDNVDQALFSTELLLSALKEWPFKYRDGKPVPIEEKTVSKLDSSLVDKLVSLLLGTSAAQDEALGPFGQPSAVGFAPAGEIAA